MKKRQSKSSSVFFSSVILHPSSFPNRMSSGWVEGGAMKLWRLWALRGPNAWAAFPVLEVGLDLGDWADLSTDRLVEVAERVAVWFPALALAPVRVGGASGLN